MTRILLLITLLIALPLTVVAVGAQSNTETLRVAVIGADEGTAAAQDDDLLRGAELASADILTGDDGAVETDDGQRYTFDLVFYPANTAAEAADAYEEAVGDGAVAIIGPSQASHINAIQDLGTLDVPLLTPEPEASAATGLYELLADPMTRAATAADYLQNQRFLPNYAVITADTATALDAAAAFTEAVGEDNVLLSLVHDADETDFTADAESIRAEGIDALYVWTFDRLGERLLAALAAEGWTGTIVYAELDAGFLATTDPALTSGLMTATNWWPSAYDNASQRFANDYRAAYDAEPSPIAAAGYDALNWIAAAVAADSLGTTALATVDYSGIQARYVDGDVTSVLLLETDAAGALVEVGRYVEGTCTTCPAIYVPDITAETFDETTVLTVALLITADGPVDVYGEHVQQGAELAVREINNAGGFLDPDSPVTEPDRYTLRLLTYPVTNAADTAAAFQQAITDGADFVLGPDLNAQTLPNLLLSEGTGAMQLTSATGLTSGLVSVPGSLLQIRANDVTQAIAASDYVLNTLNLTDIATLAVRSDYGLDAVDAVQHTLADSEDGRLVLALEHDINTTDFNVHAAQIAGAGAEVVMAWTTQPAAAALLTELDALGWQGVFVHGYLTEPALPDLPAADEITVIGPMSWAATAGDGASHTFVDRYTDRYGVAPLAQSAAYYDAIYLIRAAVEAEGLSRAALQTWFTEDLNYIGVQGRYSAVGSSGNEVSRSVAIVQVSDGALVERARYTSGECWFGCEE